MDKELGQSNPDRKRLEKRAREMEKAMKEWQKQYRKMGSDMDIQP
jgi:deoxyadenosine/deoxycytidine kinase